MHASHSPDTSATQFELLNTRTLAQGKYDTVIVPIGSCESHGDHLPFGMDALTAHALALRVGAKVPHSMVLPPTFFGMSHHYRHQPMTITLSSATTIAIVPRHFRVAGYRRYPSGFCAERSRRQYPVLGNRSARCQAGACRLADRGRGLVGAGWATLSGQAV